MEINISWDNWCKNWISWEGHLLREGYIFTEEDMEILKELDLKKDYLSVDKYYKNNLNKYPISNN